MIGSCPIGRMREESSSGSCPVGGMREKSVVGTCPVGGMRRNEGVSGMRTSGECRMREESVSRSRGHGNRRTSSGERDTHVGMSKVVDDSKSLVLHVILICTSGRIETLFIGSTANIDSGDGGNVVDLLHAS